MPALYIFYGEERFLIRREIEELTQKNPAAEVIRLDGIDGLKLRETLSLPPLFNPERLLIITGFDLRDTDEGLLCDLCSPPRGVTIILDTPEGLDRRSKVFKTLEKHAVVQEHKPLTEWNLPELVDFCLKTARELGKNLDRSLAEKLVEISGRSLGRLNSEIEKLATYAGERKTLTEEDLEKLATREGVDAFKLSAALRRRDLPAALIALEKLLGEDREDPHELLGLIGSQLRTLLKMKVGGSAAVDGSTFYIKMLKESLPLFSVDELIAGLKHLFRCDLNLKSGYNARIEMPLLLGELINVKG